MDTNKDEGKTSKQKARRTTGSGSQSTEIRNYPGKRHLAIVSQVFGRTSKLAAQVYQDNAGRDDAWVDQQRESSGVAAMEHTTGYTDRFPSQLHRMLEGVSASGHSSIVRWLPHGRGFKIYNRSSFVEDVLPVYFPFQTEFASFRRQLNLYGFLRLNCSGHDKNGYYHGLFLRGRPQMATLIPRKVGTRPNVKYTYDPDTAPDFYSMPWLPEAVHGLQPVVQATIGNLLPDTAVTERTVHASPHDTASGAMTTDSAPSAADSGKEVDLDDMLDTSDDDSAQRGKQGSPEASGETDRASQSEAKLSAWANFLEDIDFDARSDS
jgi:HSF-type DNA-binding